MSINQETDEHLTQMGIDMKNRFSELDELIKCVSKVCEKAYRDGYLQGREDMRREFSELLKGDNNKK